MLEPKDVGGGRGREGGMRGGGLKGGRYEGRRFEGRGHWGSRRHIRMEAHKVY